MNLLIALIDILRYAYEQENKFDKRLVTEITMFLLNSKHVR